MIAFKKNPPSKVFHRLRTGDNRKTENLKTRVTADGGIDLVLRKEGQLTIVQCKLWKTQRVDVKVVREMFGLLAHHQASEVKIALRPPAPGFTGLRPLTNPRARRVQFPG